ncbi:MAG: RNA polymerase sigma factor [Bacteroidales bacterium]|jgi:RNA polymerase sigma-70 factor (ECF subfamily)|nr:RNA polymerase sigma factor [Bacteroidales bacterium]
MTNSKNRFTDTQLLEKCLQNDRKAQNMLYKKYSARLFGTCLRYAKNYTDAEDILQESFIKIFKYLKDFRNEGHLEGWMRKVIVTTAINFYKRKNLLNKDVDPEYVNTPSVATPDAISLISNEELLAIVQELPEGYRMVFNLNSIEGYSHKEISEIMNISVNTSKSQLSRARNALQYKLLHLLNLKKSDLVHA